MSKFVSEIIDSIKNEPTSWKDYKGFGCQKEDIIVYGYGNTRVLSTCGVKINDKTMPLTYIDKYRLDKAVSNWYKTVSLKTIMVV